MLDRPTPRHLLRHSEPSVLVKGQTTSSAEASPPKEPDPTVVGFGGMSCSVDVWRVVQELKERAGTKRCRH